MPARRLIARLSLHTMVTGLALCSAAALANQSPDGIWLDRGEVAPGRSAQAPGERVLPARYRSLGINSTALERVLSAAPRESDVVVTHSPATLQLPLPDGRFEAFRIPPPA